MENEKHRAATRVVNYLTLALGGHLAYEKFTLAAFKPDSESAKALEAAASFDPEEDNLYFYGPAGSGKTHLGTAAIRAHKNPLVVKPYEINRMVRACDGAEAEREVIRGLIERPVLMIDDLGASKDTEFSIGLIYEIIDGRCMNMRNGLVVTSNLSLGDLGKKLGDDRLCSRLAGMCKVFKMGGRDHRVKP